MNKSPLDDHHNVARYYGLRSIGDNGLPTQTAFRLRNGEGFLSVNWLEYFHLHDKDVALKCVRDALRKKGRRRAPKSGLAVLNVGAAKRAVSQKLRYTPHITRQPSPGDESHAGIFVKQITAVVAAKVLAKQVRQSDVYPGLV